MIPNRNVLPVIRQGCVLLLPAVSAPVNGKALDNHTGPCILGCDQELEDATWIVGPDVTEDDLAAMALGHNPGVMAWVVAPEPTTLRHGTNTITVPPGTYRVIRRKDD